LGALTIHEEVKLIRDTWAKIWYAMAGGNVSDYERIKALEIHEFYRVYGIHKHKIETEHKILTSKQSK
jgi:hypothetical protein